MNSRILMGAFVIGLFSTMLSLAEEMQDEDGVYVTKQIKGLNFSVPSDLPITEKPGGIIDMASSEEYFAIKLDKIEKRLASLEEKIDRIEEISHGVSESKVKVLSSLSSRKMTSVSEN